MSLLNSRPAIDAGDNPACAPFDQRGVPRPIDGDGDSQSVCDIGAFEYQIPSALTILADQPDPSQPGETFTVTFSASASVSLPTGLVTVTVGNEPQTCSDMLIGGKGSCPLTLTVPGTYTLNAAYTSQDGSFVPSSTSDVHTVTLGPHLYLPLILQITAFP